MNVSENQNQFLFDFPSILAFVYAFFLLLVEKTKHHFLQPLSCSNTEAVVDYILAHPRWRLSLQTHKLIDIP